MRLKQSQWAGEETSQDVRQGTEHTGPRGLVKEFGFPCEREGRDRRGVLCVLGVALQPPVDTPQLPGLGGPLGAVEAVTGQGAWPRAQLWRG